MIRPTEMTPDELVDAMARLGVTNRDLAQHIGVSVRTISGWRGGRVDIPGPASLLIRVMCGDVALPVVAPSR